MSSSILSYSIDHRRHRVYLKLAGEYFFPVTLDDFTVLKLVTGQSLDDALLIRLKTLSIKSLLLNYALRQIALSPQSKKILHQKLNRRLFQFLHHYRYPKIEINQPQIIDQVLDQISQLNLIDNKTYIEHLIYRHHRKSSRYLLALFRQSAIPSEDYTPYLDELRRADRNKITQLLQRKSKGLELTDFKTRNRLTSYFIRNGFDEDMVKSIIDDFLQNR